MADEKQIEVRVPSVPGFEKLAMDFAASVAKRMGFTEERIEDLKTAVAEACLNAIEHGNKLNAGTRVGISLTMEGSKLQVAVRDEGEGIGEVETPSIEPKIQGEDKPRGWGLFLIRGLMDEVEFESPPEGGSVVRMIIHLDR